MSKRSYTKIGAMEEELLSMRKSGKTNREIAEHFRDVYKRQGVLGQRVVQIPGVDAAADCGEGQVGGEGRGPRAGLVEGIAAAAAVFDGIERVVRAAAEGEVVVPVLRPNGHAHAAGEGGAAALLDGDEGEHAQQLLGPPGRLLPAGEAGEKGQKFVPTDAGENAAGVGTLLQVGGYVGEDGVPAEVAEVVVDLLEVVQVEDCLLYTSRCV